MPISKQNSEVQICIEETPHSLTEHQPTQMSMARGFETDVRLDGATTNTATRS
tara:strand:- start:503 stop:661 length:159 start_codon:yes stop_codon:yes gene_type:complete